MKGVLFERYGPPETLVLGELPTPLPGDGEILIRVHAATVNRTDCAILRANPWIMRLFMGLRRPKLATLGTDFAGVVEAVGSEATAFEVGDRVFGFHDSGVNSYAEYLAFPQDGSVAVIPDGISFEQAAASLEGGHSARNFINQVELKLGNVVLSFRA